MSGIDARPGVLSPPPALRRRVSTAAHHRRLVARVAPQRRRLLQHGLYQAIAEEHGLRTLMRSHVFAVWDFMTLLKVLQQRLTCVMSPWFPPPDAEACRMVNEIVLGEESDDIGDGRCTSHFELYLKAMGEVRADQAPIRAFIADLRRGTAVGDALAPLSIPSATKEFVRATMALAAGETHEIAAGFLLGREDLIPAMFKRMLVQIEQERGSRCRAFRRYLERHIDLDGTRHAILGRRLLARLCGHDEHRWDAAERAARRALQVREALWTGVMEAMQSSERPPSRWGSIDEGHDRELKGY